MKTLRLLVVPALALALNVVVSAAGPIGITHAQAPNFDFNAFNWYCTTGSSTCNAANVGTSANYPGYFCSDGYDTCAGLNYGAVQVSGSIYGTSGMPGLVTLSCENYTGDGEYNAGYVNVSTTAFYNAWSGPFYLDVFSHGPWDQWGDPSVIMAGSKATILGVANENASATTSSIQATAYDAHWGNIGSVTGTQYTDDSTGYDTPINGGLTITIRSVASQFNGPYGGTGLAHFTSNGGTGFATVDYYYQGTITCHVSGAMATAIGDALAGYYNNGPPFDNGYYGAEAELDEYVLHEYNANCAYAPIILDDPFHNYCYGYTTDT